MNDIDSQLEEAFKQQPAPAPEPKEAPEPEHKDEPEHDNNDDSEQEYDADENSEESSADNDDLDEYGNDVQKEEKTFTQSQVEAMIRDRLSRGQNKQPTEQQNQQNNSDIGDSDNWEQQLEGFMDSWASKREQINQQKQWQQAEQNRQQEFESKFNSGMSKYSDFNDVVSKSPIDDTMLIATRGMKDPAAFIYAAAKKQLPELQRIAQIQDPYTKTMEIGRLDERMKKARSKKSSAPRPGTKTKGDASNKPPVISVDEMIEQYAQKNLKR